MTAPLLLPYQARWVQDPAAVKVAQKSRRVGLSWAEAYDSVLYAADARGGDVYYQAASLDMTEAFVADCRAWADRLQIAVRAAGEDVVLVDGVARPRHRLDLANGRHVEAMTSAPRAFRSHGRPGDRAVIDEAAHVDDLGAVLKAARAFRMWGGSLRVISSHNGEGSQFARLVRDVRDGRAPGSFHSIPLRAALDDGLHRRICEVAGTEWTPDAEAAWEADLRAEYGEDAAEELDCVPSAGGGAWLSWDLIRQAERPEAGRPAATGGGRVFVGVDIARRGDLWVAAVVEHDGRALWLRELVVERDIPFAAQHAVVRRLVAQYRPVRVAIDQTGMGEEFVEREQATHGAHRVEGVLFTAPRRLDIATSLKERLQDRQLLIPEDDALRADLHSVRREAGPTGAPRLVAAADETDGHADRFWALGLAVAAAAEAPRRYAYEPVGRGPRGADPFEDDEDLPRGRWDAFAAPGRLGRWAGRGLP